MLKTLALLSASLLTLLTFSGKETSELVVKVYGFENSNGHVRVALYNNEETFASESAFQGLVGKIEADSATVVFNDIEYGEYGIALIHDENDNEKMDFNFIGIPTEDYAFSNNASGTFGPPDWDEAKFKVDSKQIIHIININ